MPQPPNRPGPRRTRMQYDHLLYRLAFPSSREEWDKTAQDLNELEKFVTRKIAAGNSSYTSAFTGSGFPGTGIIASFSLALSRWLVQTFPNELRIASCTADPETIRIFFRALLPRTEYESISAGELSLRKRIRLLKGSSPVPDLEWLVQILDASRLAERVKEYLFHSLQIYTRWKRSKPLEPVARWQNKVFLHSSSRKKNIRLSLISRHPLPAPVRLSLSEKKELVSLARYSLALLCRETEPFTYADPEAVTCFQLENGLTIVLYGMEPDRRLSIESYIGYLACRNGIPVAYGGGWIFGYRCQFGINILPAFRGAGSAEVFASLVRVYRQYYGISQLFVKPYQFGKNNPEAIRSGAFWFYYKMGFRPGTAAVQQLALQERKKIKADSRYRCSPAILQQLAGANLLLRFDPSKKPLPDAALLSAAISRMIGEKFGGDREMAKEACAIRLGKLLEIRKTSLAKNGMTLFYEWSLLVGAVLHFDSWSNTDRKAFREMLSAKAHPDERVFILQLQKTGRFWKDIATLPVSPLYI